MSEAQAGPASWAVAAVCYAVALLGSAALVVLVLLLGLDVLPSHHFFSLPFPWLVNVGWLIVFGLQHSGMARAGFKRAWARWVPSHLQRSVYAGLSGLLVLGLAATWQPLPGAALWRGPPWLVAVPLSAALGLVLVNRRFDHAGLFGLRQVREQGRHPTADRLLVVGPYRWVRHPLMACLLVFLWAQPVMTPTLAALSLGLTAYVAVGVILEERDLVSRFGDAYLSYRRRVPALVPWRRPAAPAVYDPVSPP